jgi:hypothetical protein
MHADPRSLEMAQEINTALTIWQNVRALMVHHYEREDLTRLARECDFAQSTASRIKAGKHATGIDKLDAIARRFHLATWQLLVPGFDPKNPPALQPVSEKERKLYERIMTSVKEIASDAEAGQYRPK